MQKTRSIGKAIAHMERHLKDPLTIDEIARASGFSKSTLQRRFLDTTKVTAALFLRRLRLNAAAHELVATKRRIVDIALDYQFESQQTFTRAFKQATWLTPGEARRLKRLPDFAGFDARDRIGSSVPGPLIMRGVMIFTNNVETLKRFYHEVIGLAVVDPDPGFTQFDAGGPILVLHKGARRGFGDKRSAVEITFYSEDVEATRKELIARGVKAGPVAVFGDLRLCKVADPDGNILGISNRPLGRSVGAPRVLTSIPDNP